MQFVPERPSTQIQVFLHRLVTGVFDSSNNCVRQLTLSHITGGGLPPREYSIRTGCLLHFFDTVWIRFLPVCFDSSNEMHAEIGFRRGRRRRPPTSSLGFLMKIGPAASCILPENSLLPSQHAVFSSAGILFSSNVRA